MFLEAAVSKNQHWTQVLWLHLGPKLGRKIPSCLHHTVAFLPGLYLVCGKYHSCSCSGRDLGGGRERERRERGRKERGKKREERGGAPPLLLPHFLALSPPVPADPHPVEVLLRVPLGPGPAAPLLGRLCAWSGGNARLAVEKEDCQSLPILLAQCLGIGGRKQGSLGRQGWRELPKAS